MNFTSNSTGYDWIHGAYESEPTNEESWENGDEEEYGSAMDAVEGDATRRGAMKLKSLKKEVREMQRRGDI